MKIRFGLLPRVIVAIALGILCSLFFPEWLTRVFVTIEGLFGNFLSFIIPLLILGLVAPGTAALLHNTSTIGLCLRNMTNMIPDEEYYRV